MKLPEIRVLPLTIAAAAALLTVQAGSLWQDASIGFGTPAHAEQTADTAPDPAKAHEKPGDAKTKAHDGAAADEEPQDLLSGYTPEEVEVLYDLARRREALDRREAELESRLALVDAAEKRMEARVSELQGLRKAIETLLRQYDDQERKELESVVKIYETMKPKDAAAILEKLEMPVLLGIVDAMKERRSSAILAAMTPARAREVTAEMARNKVIDLTRVDGKDNPG